MTKLKDLFHALLYVLNSNPVLFCSFIGLFIYNNSKNWVSSLAYALLIYFVLNVSIIPFKDSVVDLADSIKTKLKSSSEEQRQVNILLSQISKEDCDTIRKLVKNNNQPIQTIFWIQNHEMFDNVKNTNIWLSTYFIIDGNPNNRTLHVRKKKFKFFKKAYKKTKGQLNLIDSEGNYIDELIK